MLWTALAQTMLSIHNATMPFLLRSLVAVSVLATSICFAELDEPTFTVMVYNTENVFDADGLALYEDYLPTSTRNASPYSPAKTLTKIQNVARNVAQLNDGQGPDIIMFQEFERDLSPGELPFDYTAFLEKYSGTTVDAMLTTGLNEETADLPTDALMLKYFEDNGLAGYNVAVAESLPDDPDPKAHNNVIFTRFPIITESSYPTSNARPIQVVTVEAYGSPLTLINNHWKSGASSSRTENDRILNAKDTRAIVYAMLAVDPNADIIVAGDLNTYYNAAEYFPSIGWERQEYAIAVLGSQGDEVAIQEADGPLFYNLWFELPKEERGSEFYQGAWGTLMQMLLTRGLYDRHGVHYVDGSFRRLQIPEVTVSGPWGEPVRWYFLGDTGGGFSDHLPIAADFHTDGVGTPGEYAELKDPSHEASAPAWVPTVDFASLKSKAKSTDELAGLDDNTLPKHYGQLYTVDTSVTDNKPLSIRLDDRDYQIYSYDSDVRKQLKTMNTGERIRFVGQLDEHGGRPQFIIHDASWLTPPHGLGVN